MGLFRRPRVDPEELATIKEQVRFMREHWDARRAAAEDVDDRDDAQPAAGDVAKRLDDVASQLETWSVSHEELRAKLAELDARISSVSTELANQITELGNDIDTLNRDAPPGDSDDTHLELLRTGQERLANEQARYQIAFREDLARLAEQLRKASSR